MLAAAPAYDPAGGGATVRPAGTTGIMRAPRMTTRGGGLASPSTPVE
jgi:hypothetical protein